MDKKVMSDETKHDYDEVEFVHEANTATKKEHEMTLGRALKAYPRAIMWSVLLSFAVVMEGNISPRILFYKRQDN